VCVCVGVGGVVLCGVCVYDLLICLQVATWPMLADAMGLEKNFGKDLLGDGPAGVYVIYTRAQALVCLSNREIVDASRGCTFVQNGE